jgi:hypothetical protein
MKRISFLVFLLLLTVYTFAQESEFLKFLKSQPQIQSIEKITGNDLFKESYSLKVLQPLDYTDPGAGFFIQRVYVSFVAPDAPTVLVTEGYSASTAGRSTYLNELSRLLNANQIEVEHRYFGGSWPDSVDWKYLTVENAANDHHNINQLFRKYFKGKWLATGISKGGQVSLSYRTYFPDDVDLTVDYVGPLNFKVEDGRHEPFIRNIPGTPEQREKVKNFQLEVLKRRATIFPMFKDLVAKNKYSFRIPLEEVYDFCVLEYSFAFWQFGTKPELIPGTDAPDSTIFKHFTTVASPDYFSYEGMEPTRSFFVQAAKEIGYYGYDTKPFKKYMVIKTAENYLPRIFLPHELKFKFDVSSMKKTQKFINTTDKNILFIYGEFDPWSATAVNIPNKPNLLKVYKQGGSHGSRISNLPEPLKQQVLDQLYKWMDVKK